MWQRSFRSIRILILGVFLISLSGCDIAGQMEQMFKVGQDITRDMKNELGVDAMVMSQSYGRMGSMVSVQILNASQVENVSLSELKRSIEPIIVRHHGAKPTQLVITVQYMQVGTANPAQPAVSVTETGLTD